MSEPVTFSLSPAWQLTLRVHDFPHKRCRPLRLWLRSLWNLVVQGWRDLFCLLGWVKPDRQTPHSPKTRKIKSLQPEQTGRHNTETSIMFGERDPFRRLQKFYMGLDFEAKG